MSTSYMKRKAAALTALTVAAVLVVLLAAFVLGCESSENKAGTENGGGKGETEANGGREEDKEVDQGPVTLTLYFIANAPGQSYLQAERRTIPYTQAVARAALEELFKGPSAESGLMAVFPPTVKVLDVSIADGVCTVNLSREIITEKGPSGGAGAMTEGLALVSIANTLTEFPTIEKVRLLVEGKQSGMVDGMYIEDFWGHVGLPEYLERDLSMVGPR